MHSQVLGVFLPDQFPVQIHPIPAVFAFQCISNVDRFCQVQFNAPFPSPYCYFVESSLKFLHCFCLCICSCQHRSVVCRGSTYGVFCSWNVCNIKEVQDRFSRRFHVVPSFNPVELSAGFFMLYSECAISQIRFLGADKCSLAEWRSFYR